MEKKKKRSGRTFPSFPGTPSSLDLHDPAHLGFEKLGMFPLCCPLEDNCHRFQKSTGPTQVPAELNLQGVGPRSDSSQGDRLWCSFKVEKHQPMWWIRTPIRLFGYPVFFSTLRKDSILLTGPQVPQCTYQVFRRCRDWLSFNGDRAVTAGLMADLLTNRCATLGVACLPRVPLPPPLWPQTWSLQVRSTALEDKQDSLHTQPS